MTTPDPIFPFDFESLAPAGVVASFTAFELGAFLRLARYAWSSDPPCTLPDDATRLAAIVGCSQEQLAEVWPRILLTVEPFRGGRLLLPAAARIHRELSARQDRRRSAATKAIRSRWGKSPPPDDPGGGGPDTTRIRDVFESNANVSPRLQISKSSALPLERSTPRDLNPSAQTDVLAELSAGARAAAEERVSRWRRDHCRSMIEKALAGWVSAGYADRGFGPPKVAELLAGPHTTPARVETLIADASYAIEMHKAGRASKPRPVGILIHGLGLSQASAGRPKPVAMQVEMRWQEMEAQTVQTAQSLAAVQARLDALRAATTTTTSTTAAGRKEIAL